MMEEERSSPLVPAFRKGLLESLDEGQKVLYFRDLYNKSMTLMEIASKWNVTAMTVSRHRRDPKLMGARKQAARENYDKALVKAQKKTGVGRDLAGIQERAQHAFEVADTPNPKGMRDVKGMVEALRIELETVKTVAELHGHLGKEQAPQQSTNITVNPQFMIAMPRVAGAPLRAGGDVLDAEVVEELPGREDARLIEDGTEG